MKGKSEHSMATEDVQTTGVQEGIEQTVVDANPSDNEAIEVGEGTRKCASNSVRDDWTERMLQDFVPIFWLGGLRLCARPYVLGSLPLAPVTDRSTLTRWSRRTRMEGMERSREADSGVKLYDSWLAT